MIGIINMKTVLILVLLSLTASFTADYHLSKSEAVVFNEEDASFVAEEHEYLTSDEPQFWVSVLVASLCTLTGAFCSGMTVGLLSINTMQLQMMMLKPKGDEKKMADAIYSLVSDHHLFLVTLLIANAIALQSLPIIVHKLMPAWAAILFSTFVVLIAAEIIPQAYCTGPKKIQMAYYAAPIINIMIKIFFPLSWPIAKGLDKLVGLHSHKRIQHKDFVSFLNQDKMLKDTEKMLLTSTLELRTERVTDIMIPISRIFMLEAKELITAETTKQIYEKDYSYVLVYRHRKQDVIGVIKIKEFALKYVEEAGQIRAEDIFQPNTNLLSVYCDTNLLEMLMLFQSKFTRIALVCNQRRKVDPAMESIMYSKSDMIIKVPEAEVIGVVFLYQLFSEMAKFKEVIVKRESQMNPIQSTFSQEMTTLRRPLLE